MQQYELIEKAIRKSFQNFKDSSDYYLNTNLVITSTGIRRLSADIVGNKRSAHAKGLAVDIAIEPIKHMLDFYKYLADGNSRKEFGDKTNCFISLNNHHIHCDWDFAPDNISPWRREAKYLVEMPYNEVKRIYPLVPYTEVIPQLELHYGSRIFTIGSDYNGQISVPETKHMGCVTLILIGVALSVATKIIMAMVV